MFRKYLIFAMFATATGYCFADEVMSREMTQDMYNSGFYDYGNNDYVPSVAKTKTHVAQAVTSEVFDENGGFVKVDKAGFQNEHGDVRGAMDVPAWPLAGSDADVSVSCDGATQNQDALDNVRIVSKVGDDMVVENNFEFNGTGWTGGANMLHGKRIPVGFDNECDGGAEMSLLRREMLEDDGGDVLAVSRSARKNCTTRNGAQDMAHWDSEEISMLNKGSEMQVENNDDSGAQKVQPDQVRSWVVASGQTLREVLQDWCDKEGWDLVWSTSREYPIEASAVFKGRFTDVASALVRNFGRATPVPYAKFYKGNLVLVISTNED